MSFSIHITNSKGTDATVAYGSVKSPPGPKFAIPGEAITFRRYLAATESGMHTSLKGRLGENYAQQLIDSDPEVDIERVGSLIERTQTIYLDSSGEIMFADPAFIELILDPNGVEKERRIPGETSANTNSDVPVRWTGKKIAIGDAVRRFSFKRTLQIQHVDGLSYQYLFDMASELEAGNALMLIGTGDKGAGPLIFQTNGRPYRGFLEGRTRDKSYCLLLHLSDLELKRPNRLAKGANEL